MMTDTGEWSGRTGENWAAEWRRTDRGFAPLTERLLLRSRGFSFNKVLDVGSGAGELSLAIGRGRPQTTVIGVDISPALTVAARERGGNLPNVSFEVGDAAQWDPPAGFAPDLVVSRHGVMFFSDPLGAFEHLAEVAAPGAGLLFSCFRNASENPFFTEVLRVLPNEAGLPSDPGPFAFADKAKVTDFLNRAGWTGIDFEPFDFAMVAGLGSDPIQDAIEYFSRIGIASRALAEAEGDARDDLIDKLRGLAQRHRFGNLVSLRGAAWIVTGRKA